MLALKIGSNYYTIGQGSTLQKISEADIIARGGDIQKQIQSGDIQVVDPSQLNLAPASKYEGGSNPTGYYLELNGQPINLGGSALRITNQAEAQALGLTNLGGANLTPGGIVATDTDAQRINEPTSKTFGGTISADMTGTSSSQPSQIYRDNQNNFFAVDAQGNRTPLNLDQFHALGLNEKFVQPGQTVSLSQAQTGQVGAPGSSGATGGTTGGAGGIAGLPSWADQKAIDGLKFVFGWSDAQAQQYVQSNPKDAQMWAMAGEYQKGQLDAGQAKLATTAQAWNDAFTAATKELDDPTSSIGAKYADLQKTDVANFQQNLSALQGSTDIQTQQQRTDFQNQQKQQAEAAAAAGQAYSGYREQAKQQLGTQQSGIVKSTLADLKQKIQSQFQPLEQFYGSSRFASLFPNAGIAYANPLTGTTENVAYTPVGGLTGSESAQKQADVESRQSQIFQNIKPS